MSTPTMSLRGVRAAWAMSIQKRIEHLEKCVKWYAPRAVAGDLPSGPEPFRHKNFVFLLNQARADLESLVEIG